VVDQLELDILAGTIAALRKRADRQRGIAVAHGDRSGEAAIALRIAAAFEELAAEFEREPPCG
jgi:hypothetical protein